MSTEYRRGIPSTAHVEAATRLGLLWQQADAAWREWCFEVRGGDIWCDFAPWDRRGLACLTENNRVMSPARAMSASWRPIHPDGTPVDWEVLDQEVARVEQRGQPQTTASAQPQGFRADLWARLNEWITTNWLNTLSDIEVINDRGISGLGYDRRYSWDELGLDTAADEADRQALIARWTVYQELKPLYDIVDGAQGEAAIPRDVEAEWDRQAGAAEVRTDGDWSLYRNANGFFAQSTDGTTLFAGDRYGAPLRNFATVLDAVAERRVAERMRGQTQATTVTSAQPEPRRFADVRPDRHGWRWWRQTGRDSTDLGQRFETQDGRCRWRSAHAEAWFAPDTANPQMLRYTVIPTDEQGNPVSWESIGTRQSAAQPTFNNMPIHATTFSNSFNQPLTYEGLEQVLRNMHAIGRASPKNPTGQPPQPVQPEPLPRFTADELDDVDHSKTTKLDEVTLRRGKLPTVEQIAKYREARARRTGGSAADALKESRIDCEVAQYVLERWAGGLGDELALWLLRAVGKYSRSELRFTQRSVDELAQRELTHEAGAIETAESSPAVQRKRQEVEERRQRLAELRQRLATERAAQPQEMAKESEVSRFDLIEPDPQADPAASICAWEARQAATKVCPATASPRVVKPAAAPRRPSIEVVDAEVDGLSRSEAFAALFGRALNGGC